MVSALHVSGIIPYFRFTTFTASVLYLAFKTSTFWRIVFAQMKKWIVLRQNWDLGPRPNHE